MDEGSIFSLWSVLRAHWVPSGILESLESFFTDSEKRLFWVYLLSSAIIALVYLFLNRSKMGELWAAREHRGSLLLDVKFWLFNAVTKVVLGGLAFLSSLKVGSGLLSELRALFPDYEALVVSDPVVILMTTLFSFVAFDFLKFFQHYLMHKVPFLWSFHQVHHTATYLTPMTLYRMHPVENLVSYVRNSVGKGLVFGLLLFVFGSRINAYDFLGLNALAFVFNLLGANLRHSPLPISFGPLESIFISPAQHQIHHSTDSEHHNKNFGVALALWDQLFGTFLPYKKIYKHGQSLSFGVQDGPICGRRASFCQHLFTPFTIGFQQLKTVVDYGFKWFTGANSNKIFMQGDVIVKISQWIAIGSYSLVLGLGANSFAIGSQKTYSFLSKADPRASSVDYSGQVFRQVLISDLKTYMDQSLRGMGASIDESYIYYWSLIDFDRNHPDYEIGAFDGNGIHSVASKPIPLLEAGASYGELIDSNKQILNKLAGNDKGSFYFQKGIEGWVDASVLAVDPRTINVDGNNDNFMEAEDLLAAFIYTLAYNESETGSFLADRGGSRVERVKGAHITPEGLDLSQLTNKLLHGALSLSQISGDYLSVHQKGKGLLVDNSQVKEGQSYTALEHHWDEGFGYFGAARNYLLLSDSEIKEGISKDMLVDGVADGKVSLFSEKNFGLSVLAAKRDLGSVAGHKTNFSGDIMGAYLEGRELIARAGEGFEEDIKIAAEKVIRGLERVIAASVIHYINSTLKEMDQYGSEEYFFSSHAKYWSEMKGYALALQFAKDSPLSLEEFKRLHSLVGDRPVLMTAQHDDVEKYRRALLQARGILQTTYQFAQENVAAW